MRQKEFLDRLMAEYLNNVAISKAKNSDYATDDDAFLNFRASAMIGIDPKVAILVRMSDKFVRVSNLVSGKEPAVNDEKIGDTLSDLANYAMILKLFIEHEKNKKN